MLKQSAENARLKRIQQEEELKRKLRERQAEALAALQKRSGYQMKEKCDKGWEFLVHTNLLSLESKVQEILSKFVLYKFVNRRNIKE